MLYSGALLLLLLALVLALEPRARAYDWVLFPLTFVGLFTLESSLLIVPLIVALWWRNAPGVSLARSGGDADGCRSLPRCAVLVWWAGIPCLELRRIRTRLLAGDTRDAAQRLRTRSLGVLGLQRGREPSHRDRVRAAGRGLRVLRVAPSGRDACSGSGSMSARHCSRRP